MAFVGRNADARRNDEAEPLLRPNATASTDQAASTMITLQSIKSFPRTLGSLVWKFGSGCWQLVHGEGVPPDADSDPTHPYHGENLKHLRYEKEMKGYPRLATWLASDPAFAIGRNFAALRNRVILHKLYKVEYLRNELEQFDRKMHDEDDEALGNTSADIEEGGGKRDKMIENINKELKDYDELLLREIKFRSLPRPSERRYRSLIMFLHLSNETEPEERQPFHIKNEMVSLAGSQEFSWLDEKVEEAIDLLPVSIAEWIFTEHEYKRSGEEHTHYYSRRRIEVFVTIITAFVVSFSLGAPVGYLAYQTSGEIVGLVVVLIFIWIFPFILAILSRVKQQDIFPITAAFTAVLVVFLAIPNQSR